MSWPVDPTVVVAGGLILLAVVVFGLVWSRRSERLAWLRRALMVVLLAGIAWGPGVGREPVPTRTAEMEIVVVLDRTTSMSALDWRRDRSRLEGARADIAELVDALPTGRFTLVTFGRRAAIDLPSTKDERVIADTVELVTREEPLSGVGSRLDRPLNLLTGLLRQMRQRDPQRVRLVVLMSDGENTGGGRQQTYKPLTLLAVDGGAVLGYGSKKGARMPAEEDRPAAGWVTDAARGRDAVSRIDQRNLRRVADQLDAPYLHRTRPGGLEDLAATWTDQFRESTQDGVEVPNALQLYWMFALALLPLALLDLRHFWRRLLRARRSR
ncbi:VWA domain-containing protein [Nocardioides dongkuii]|uniref:VWA domain-containing protein n=1 Tax=Nocardioides dongkuii TaxID=2760089 RepID=UPI001878338C|nr:VWA domain-containing protein [Nocardioides dongkuii]